MLGVLGVVGVAGAQEALYRLLLRHPQASVAELSAASELSQAEVEAQLEGLVASGLVDVRGDSVLARPPHQSLSRLINDESRRLEDRGAQLETARKLLPAFTAEHIASSRPKGVEIPLEVVENADVVRLVRNLTLSSSGDLLWLRPDPWNITLAPTLTEWVKEVMASGRRSRAIYPARVFEAAPEQIRERAEAGEHVRILAEVPCRLAVLGDSAVVDDNFAEPNDRRLVVRQPTMVHALTLLFEGLWEKAMAVPGYEPSGHVGFVGDRRLLLGQLATGAKDEQIARALGMSLRTVRRRVAELIHDLGAQSRFQAGVEAVRRGWI